MMQVLLWLLVPVVAGGLVWLLIYRQAAPLPEVVDERPQPRIPAGPFTVADLNQVRFAMAPRGYNCREVDELLDRIKAALASPDPELKRQVSGECVRLQFPVTRNGYQMGQVDAVLDRVAHELGVDSAVPVVTESPGQEPEIVGSQANLEAQQP